MRQKGIKYTYEYIPQKYLLHYSKHFTSDIIKIN